MVSGGSCVAREIGITGVRVILLTGVDCVRRKYTVRKISCGGRHFVAIIVTCSSALAWPGRAIARAHQWLLARSLPKNCSYPRTDTAQQCKRSSDKPTLHKDAPLNDLSTRSGLILSSTDKPKKGDVLGNRTPDSQILLSTIQAIAAIQLLKSLGRVLATASTHFC